MQQNLLDKAKDLSSDVYICLSYKIYYCFAIKSLKLYQLYTQFNIQDYINFSSANTRSGANNKLVIPRHLNNTSRHSYYHQLATIANSLDAMPILDLDQPFHLLKSKLKDFLWDHFIKNFNDNILHYLCPCSSCHLLHPPTTKVTSTKIHFVQQITYLFTCYNIIL